jgi:hypothetical protein
MKIDLPGLSLALQRASLGIRRTEDPSSGAVLLSASKGSLRASMVADHRLSVATCPCEGDLEVAVEADRLKKLLDACTAPAAELIPKDGDLIFKAGGVKAKLRGYDIQKLPRHAAPALTQKLSLSAELVDRTRYAEKLTRDRVDHNSRIFEKVILLELKDGIATIFAGLASSMALWHERPWNAEDNLFVGINRQLVSLMPAGPQDLVWSDNHIGFETEDFATYESRIETDGHPHSAYRKPLAHCPAAGSGFNPKDLSSAINGALSVYSVEGLHRPIVLEAKDSVLEVIWESSAGDFSAEVVLFGPSNFKGKFNADLLTKIASGLKAPHLAVKDMTLWIWEGSTRIALQGMRL